MSCSAEGVDALALFEAPLSEEERGRRLWRRAEWDEEDYGGFNYVGKGGNGKRKGKGSGECHHCGEKGHFKRECPKIWGKGGKGDTKGGGKGMVFLSCKAPVCSEACSAFSSRGSDFWSLICFTR